MSIEAVNLFIRSNFPLPIKFPRLDVSGRNYGGLTVMPTFTDEPDLPTASQKVGVTPPNTLLRHAFERTHLDPNIVYIFALRLHT